MFTRFMNALDDSFNAFPPACGFFCLSMVTISSYPLLAIFLLCMCVGFTVGGLVVFLMSLVMRSN